MNPDIRNTMATCATDAQQQPVTGTDFANASPGPSRTPEAAADVASLAAGQPAVVKQEQVDAGAAEGDDRPQKASKDDKPADVKAEVVEEAGQEDDPSGTHEELPDGVTWQQQLWECLHSGAASAPFACAYMLPAMPFGCPEVVVEGVGQLVLPLCPEQASTLRAVAEQAPYGKGMDTLVDTDVRCALQVDACHVAIGPSWQQVMHGLILPAVTAGLGLAGPSAASRVYAELYKLLLYEQGGHFAAHRDTEKAPSMFATLVVQLPCMGGHNGGSLLVRHGGKEVHFGTAQASDSTFQMAAFFADCEHQLLPITTGRRLVLVYNLCWAGQGSAPHVPNASQAAVLAAAVRAWERELAAGGSQKRLALRLEHQYTSANLSFAYLKGADRLVADALAACPLLDCHLALITRTVIGDTGSPVRPRWSRAKRRRWFEYHFGEGGDLGDEEFDEDGFGYGDDGYCGWGHGRSSDGRHTMAQVHARYIVTEWRAPDGSSVAYAEVDPSNEYFDPEGQELYGGDPDDETYTPYLGNSGPTLEYVYHRAMLVLWPRSRSLAAACATAVEAVLSLLAVRLAERTNLGSTGDASESWTHAQAALDAVPSCFANPPQRAPSYGGRYSSTPAASAPAYALQLLLAARAAGLPNAEQAAAQLLPAMAAPAWAQDMAQDPMPAALAQLVATFNSVAVNTAVVELVQRWAAAQHQVEVSDSSAATARQQAEAATVQKQARACAAVVAALAGQPGLQRQVALAASGALQAASQSASAAGQPGSAPPAQTWQLLLDAVWAQPGVRQQLALAAAGTLLGGDMMQHQTFESVLALSELLLGSLGLGASHYKRFAAACLQRPDCQDLLQQLLQSPAVKAAAATLPAVRRLAAARLAFLQAQTAVPPVFSWCMTQASVPGHPQVEEFLRGPQQEATFRGFQNICDARGWASEIFSKYGPASASAQYSADATPGGRGRTAYCRVVKTQALYDRQVAQHNAWVAEMQAVAAMCMPLA